MLSPSFNFQIWWLILLVSQLFLENCFQHYKPIQFLYLLSTASTHIPVPYSSLAHLISFPSPSFSHTFCFPFPSIWIVEADRIYFTQVLSLLVPSGTAESHLHFAHLPLLHSFFLPPNPVFGHNTHKHVEIHRNNPLTWNVAPATVSILQLYGSVLLTVRLMITVKSQCVYYRGGGL